MPFFSLPSGASPVLAGTGAPTGGVGNAGDLFIDRANKLLYGPKDAVSGWPTGIDLSKGPTGPASTVPGPTGPASNVTGPAGPGITGPTGAASTVTGPTGGLTSIAIGTVTTGVANVTVTGTGATRTLSFVLPFVTGPTGAASTGPTGSQGVSITGPTGAASTVPGPTGPAGGPTGPTGPGARQGASVISITGPLTLTEADGRYQFIEPVGGAQDVIVPTGVSAGYDLVISNTATDFYSLAYLQLKTNTDASVAIVGLGGSIIVVFDGTNWRTIFLVGGYYPY